MSKSARKWINLLILAASALAVVWILRPVFAPASPKASALPSASTEAAPLSVGQPAPNFTLTTASGQTVSLSALRGHPVILNFWATWCPWCKQEIPAFEALKRQYGSRIALYGVDIQETPATVSGWLKSHPLNYPILLDTSGGVAADYAVQAVPTTVFISPSGKIAAIHLGAFSDQQAMAPYVQSLVEGKGS
ncbi:MAG: TlpA family protein disulfide reductase [Firmicutes bacterium]|nr:TlpA family protein disulfide reductase [Bacillota bacterium]